MTYVYIFVNPDKTYTKTIRTNKWVLQSCRINKVSKQISILSSGSESLESKMLNQNHLQQHQIPKIKSNINCERPLWWKF